MDALERGYRHNDREREKMGRGCNYYGRKDKERNAAGVPSAPEERKGINNTKDICESSRETLIYTLKINTYMYVCVWFK